ncbi:MAG TPA: type 1 glutamine amidotransferase [Ktedonobacteraceae bacterium]|nr:type 1 glutamine amidotransferase [Ktedonobacteraceae bacterium]
MKRVLALQNYWDDPPGYLGEIMQEHDIPYDIINVEKDPLPVLASYSAIIALGGVQNANAHDKYPYLLQEKKLLRAAVEQDIPYLGICLGGQLLASALDAPISRHHMTEVGFFTVQLTEEGKKDSLFQGLPGYQQVIHWHEDAFSLPAGAIKLASSENTVNEAFRVGRRAYGLQYHLEITPAMFDIWFGQEDLAQNMSQPLDPAVFEQVNRDRLTHYQLYLEHSRIVFENFLKISECL